MNENIKNEAISIFERYPSAKEVFVTPDLQAFLQKDRAILHDKDVTTVKRSQVMTEKKADETPKMTAPELVVFIATVDSLEDLDALTKGEKRATVTAALASRKEEITNAKKD